MTWLRYILLARLAFTVAAPTTPSSPIVSMRSGLVMGTSTSEPNGGAVVNKFLGIPLAKSPPMRFAPPESPEPWENTLVAQHAKPACIQQFNFMPPYPQQFHDRVTEFENDPPLAESEDCLYVNVFAPATKPHGKGRSVMVFFYGGTLQAGGNMIPDYDGGNLAANQDVIIVVPNYRTGRKLHSLSVWFAFGDGPLMKPSAFGFSNSPEIPFGEQNSGFLDERFALEWVQQNIQAFGGDPEKVTVFGESAGALFIKHLITLPPPDPIPFRAAIIESYPNFPTNGTEAWNALVRKSNCSKAQSPLHCVRDLPASTIKGIAEENYLMFNPVADNITFAADARSYFLNANAAKVPILIGGNADEGSVFAWVAGADNPSMNVRAFVNAAYAHQPKQQLAIIDAYRAQINDSLAFESRFDGDTTFHCPLAAFSDLLVDTGYNAWRYLFRATFPNMHAFPESGAYHSAEVPLVFGTYPEANATAQQRSLSEYMQTTWANFAKDPHRGAGWPMLGEENDVRILGGVDSDWLNNVNRAQVDGVCHIYADILDGPL